jgi:hypothetical protein
MVDEAIEMLKRDLMTGADPEEAMVRFMRPGLPLPLVSASEPYAAPAWLTVRVAAAIEGALGRPAAIDTTAWMRHRQHGLVTGSFFVRDHPVFLAWVEGLDAGLLLLGRGELDDVVVVRVERRRSRRTA